MLERSTISINAPDSSDFLLFLDACICIGMLKQVVHSIDMQQIIGFLSVRTGIIGIWIVAICGNL